MIIGIDPGLSGACAYISKKVYGIGVFDLPTIKKGKTGNKREIDCKNLYHKLSSLNDQDSIIKVYLEDVHAMPGQGVTSMFSMGHTLGAIKGVVAALPFELHLVSPQKWKKYFSLTKDKELSRARAIHLFPTLADQLTRKKDADRAEALLIARYGSETQ